MPSVNKQVATSPARSQVTPSNGSRLLKRLIRSALRQIRG